VRSHSRLDLYAKSLAVSLLGCLGAIGALIDYWPGQTFLPDVPSVSEDLRRPVVLTAVNVSGYSGSSTSDISFERVSFTTEPARPVMREWSASAARVIRANLVTRPMAKVTFVGPTAPPPSLADMVENGVPVFPAELLAELPPAPEPVFWDEEEIPTAVLASSSEEHGFLSGVWRRTGNSVGTVGTTITKAGGSVVGAFRSVGDLVKRAF
jgi:hypothetical protein